MLSPRKVNASTFTMQTMCINVYGIREFNNDRDLTVMRVKRIKILMFVQWQPERSEIRKSLLEEKRASSLFRDIHSSFFTADKVTIFTTKFHYNFTKNAKKYYEKKLDFLPRIENVKFNSSINVISFTQFAYLKKSKKNINLLILFQKYERRTIFKILTI